MSNILTADNSTLLNQIGSKVCQAIIAIQVQQPELLLEKYRDIPWQSSRHQSGLVSKLIEILAQARDEKVTQQLLQKFLRALLAPESFSSPILISLFKEVAQLTPTINSRTNNQQAVEQVPLEVNGNGAKPEPKENTNSQIETKNLSVESEAPTTENTSSDTVETQNPIENASQAETRTEDIENPNLYVSNPDTLNPGISNPHVPKLNTLSSDISNSDISRIEDSSTSQVEIAHAESLEVSDNLANNTNNLSSTNNIGSAQAGIAVLLLDAENLQFNSETEKFLSSICNYPIQVKVAFANWCRKGKLDAELHARNYDLIHVPSGRDNADGKMITYGSSIHQRFPSAKEVFVCSSDNVMTNLCNHMMQNGLNVFRVVKQGSNLTVLDIQSGESHVHTVLPTIDQFISQIKDILREEEVRTANQWMKLSKISKIFHNKYNVGVNQVVSHHFRGKTAKDIFTDNPEFAIHHLHEDSETFIALFKFPQASRQENNTEKPRN